MDAVKCGNYRSFKTLSECKRYLGAILRDLMLNRLRNIDAKIYNKISTKTELIYAEQILLAPNVFYAAEIMSAMYFRYGNGDFSAILKLIATRKDQNFKDLSNKLALVKYGILYPSNIQHFVNEFVPERDVKIFSDSKHEFTC